MFDKIDFDSIDFSADEGKAFLKDDTFIKPKPAKILKDSQLFAEYAEELVKDINLKEGERAHCYVNGSFIFGQFLEELVYNFNFKIKELTISTLSLNADNIHSFKNMYKWGNLKKLNIIFSDYFFSHYRDTFVKHFFKELEGIPIQSAVCRTHTKVTLFETDKGGKCVIMGSANLRSSNCLEVFSIEENKELYDFHYKVHKNILEKFALTKKVETGNKLYKIITDECN